MAGTIRKIIASLLFAAATLGQTKMPVKTGPPVGSTLPEFSATDQHGAMQTLHSILGPKGALLVFFRSADW